MSKEFAAWLENLDEDYFTTSNQFTNSYHRDEYAAIKPDARLSQEGKVIVITGASAGIGQKGLAVSFARAGAKVLYLVARSQSGLEETRKLVQATNPNVKVVIKSMSVTDEAAVKELFEEIKTEHGKADVLVNNAGLGNGGALMMVPIENFWGDFVSSARGDVSCDVKANTDQEVNAKGTFIMSRYFIELLGSDNKGRIINITSAAGPFVMPGTDSYGLSKLIQVQVQRYISAVNPNVFAASLQPGSVLTAITKPAFVRFSKDTFALVGGATVWLASPEADFMNGRYLDANWDVAELVQRQDDIVKEGLLQMELKGDFLKGKK